MVFVFSLLGPAYAGWTGCADVAPTDPIDGYGAHDAAEPRDAPTRDATAFDASCASTTTPDNCGACGYVCLGFGQSGAVVNCVAQNCTFACSGENYDSDGLMGNGCEKPDDPLGNHEQTTGVQLGSFPCTDGESYLDIRGIIPSDQREHVSIPAGYSVAAGAAPDWFTLYATGGTCVNDIVLTLQIVGSQVDCFHLRAITSVNTYQCQTNSSGICGFAQGTGSYGSGTNIYISVERTCSALSGMVNYHLTGHL